MSLKSLLCRHTWEVIHQDKISTFESETDRLPVGTKFVLIQRCPKCGKVKKTVFRY